MGSVFKRRDKWRAQVSRNGRRISKDFETRREAQHWATQTEQEQRAPVAARGAKTFGEALKRYSEEVTPQKKGARWEAVRLAKLRQDRIADIQCGKLTPEDLADWRDRRLKSVAAASVNRELNLISSVIERARKEWGWIRENPVRDITRPKNPRHRDRRIDAGEIERILIALGYEDVGEIQTRQQEVGLAFLLALETAMRLGEILTLQWVDVHLRQRYLTIRDSKNDDSRDVPLSLRAVELLSRMPKDRVTVFTCGRDVASVLFRRAVRACQIPDLRFHDSRHEAITRLARKLDVLDLARMIGHRDLRSLRVYYNATAAEIAGRLD